MFPIKYCQNSVSTAKLESYDLCFLRPPDSLAPRDPEDGLVGEHHLALVLSSHQAVLIANLIINIFFKETSKFHPKLSTPDGWSCCWFPWVPVCWRGPSCRGPPGGLRATLRTCEPAASWNWKQNKIYKPYYNHNNAKAWKDNMFGKSYIYLWWPENTTVNINNWSSPPSWSSSSS